VSQVNLGEMASRLVGRGKGILAADESLPTMKKRFDAIGADSTEELRRSYRQMLFTTPEIENYISGVILFEESTRHATEQGESFVRLLEGRGIIPGVKVGTGNQAIPGLPGEVYTEGLDGLREALPAMKSLGIAFTKWRAVISVGDGLPTQLAIDTNAQLLARMAAISQEAGLVPIVEPEVLMDGEHGFDESFDATHRTLQAVLGELAKHGVNLEGLVLKTNMVMPGKQSSAQYSDIDVAQATIRCLRDVLPPAVPGVAFLSGGQSEQEATANLNAMNNQGDLPWELTFSYGRALLDSALRTWSGHSENVQSAQARFLQRARNCAAARLGEYTPDMETPPPQ
jgi:fructose-bisphosphate aldolase, class I